MGNLISDTGINASNTNLPRKTFKLDNEDSYFSPHQCSLGFDILKALTLTFLKSYSEENLLQGYCGALKKFVERYDENKFYSFLANFASLTFYQENNLTESLLPTASNSPSKMDLDEAGSRLSTKRFRYSKMRPSLEIQGYLSANAICKSGDYTKKIVKLLEGEIAKKDNFFFELTKVFGDLFAAKYKKDIQYLEKKFADVKEKIYSPEKLKEKAKEKYQQAKKDLRDFRRVIQSILKAFVVQIFTTLSQNTSVVMTQKDAEMLSLKLVFGKNKCYTTYFELIKYHVIEEETTLQKSLAEFKQLQAKDFKINPQFCFEDAEKTYQKIIDSLNYLDTFSNPSDKFKTITEINKQITKIISKSYQYDNQRLEAITVPKISANNLIPIYCYCLVKSGNAKIKRHQIFVEDFLNGELVKFGDEAYCFITLIASCNFLIETAGNPLKF